MSDIPKLRGHHLICLHFFNGKGYSREFIENLRLTLDRAMELGVEVASGIDDVCRGCPYVKEARCRHDENSDAEISEMDDFALSLLKEEFGAKIKWHAIREQMPEILPYWHEKYCNTCAWGEACEEDAFYLNIKNGKSSFRTKKRF